jgi:hypothetical protein
MTVQRMVKHRPFWGCLFVFSSLFMTACQEVQTKVIPTPTGTVVSSSSLTDVEVQSLMKTLAVDESDAAKVAIRRILAAGDQRFIAVFIELMRAHEVGIVNNLTIDDYAEVLTSLSGEEYWIFCPAWFRWYGNTNLEPPPGFVTWKGELLAVLDPRFGDFLHDDHPIRIRPEEIVWGNVRVDGLPPLDNPKMLGGAIAEYLNPEDAVFGVEFNGEARAYPLRIMDWHEMANDTIGGIPFTLSYCTLCGTAIAYDGRSPGRSETVFDFGTSGLLYRNNKLMYDRQTGTLCSQLTGKPVMGDLASEDLALEILPSVLTNWEEWQLQHPQTLVLDINTGFGFDYRPGVAYGAYFASPETAFPVAQRGSALRDKDQIFTIQLDNIPKAYPISTLVREKVINDEIGTSPLVIVAPKGAILIEGDSLEQGPVLYSAGSEVRAFERGRHQFRSSNGGDTVIDENGREWRVTEEGLVGPDSELLRRLNGQIAYWFGWYSFFPNTLVYE